MTARELDWVVGGIDLDRPNPARIYDYLLGGHHNFAADRKVAEQLKEVYPIVIEATVAVRAFVRRAIELFAREGIDQFLDIGSGLPTEGNVHELARAIIPDARVVYVDIDPVVIAHSSQILKDDPRATIIEGDVRYPESILGHKSVVDLLDFGRAMGLTMTSLLHFVAEDEVAYGATETLIEAIAPGSHVAMTHAIVEPESEQVMADVEDSYRSAAEGKARTPEEFAKFFDGLEILEPGLVVPPLWRPEGPDDLLLDSVDMLNAMVGVGRKRR